MAASVVFEFVDEDIDKESIIVPAVAVGEDGEGQFVFLIDENGGKSIVKKQQVTIGNLTPQGFEIKSGLNVGQKIATAGLQTLLDGQEVKLN